ncbi:MAG: FHIPEP family type III secretion protein, partial [Cellvibrionaceae bacterium]|nr:FHIPEP family type III secretion protein [Cellvibrionaceae bacterium]
MGSIPGMPHVSFLSLAFAAGGLAIFVHRRNLKRDQPEQAAAADSPRPASGGGGAGELVPVGPGEAAAAVNEEISWDDVMPVDIIGLEVGYRIIPLVDASQNGELLGRIKGVRKKLSQDVGFLIPSVHIRDNLDLSPTAYRISLMGVSLGEAEVYPDSFLAIDPGQVFGKLDGIKTQDPAFGLEAVWIEDSQKDHAQTLGYTVVDAATVIATHLNQILQKHANELLGHEDVQKLLDILAEKSPKLAEELVPNTISLNVLLKVLQGLL